MDFSRCVAEFYGRLACREYGFDDGGRLSYNSGKQSNSTLRRFDVVVTGACRIFCKKRQRTVVFVTFGSFFDKMSCVGLI